MRKNPLVQFIFCLGTGILPMGFVLGVTPAYSLNSVASIAPNKEVQKSTQGIKKPSRQHPLIEIKGGYFFFVNSDMKEVYNQGGTDVQLAGSVPIWSVLNAYASVGYIQKSGHSISDSSGICGTIKHQKTSLWEVPFSLGLRAAIPWGDHVQYYLTVGPRYFLAYAHNNSDYVPRHMHANGLGMFGNTGFLFLWRHFTFDLFGEYSYVRMGFHGHGPSGSYHNRPELSGVTCGGGFGYSF